MNLHGNTHDILTHYGSPIPKGVGKAAICYGAARKRSHYPQIRVKLRPSDGSVLDDMRLRVQEVDTKDGFVVSVESDDGDVYYALPDGVVKPVVAQLTEHTNFVVVDGEDEYLPTDDTETGEIDGKNVGDSESLQLSSVSECSAESNHLPFDVTD